MAIIRNVVMRGASKRLGGVVFYTRSGETVARELAPAVSNPRTEVQMQQRIKLANVVAAYKANKSWMAGAFEDKAEKESDYNAFVRFNLTDSRVALNKSQSAAGAAIVAPYKISSGSIPSIDCTSQTTGVRTNLYTGALIITQNTTVGQFSAALMSNNNGIVRDMQLSLIVNIQRSDGNLVRPYIVCRAYELIINETNTKLLSDYVPYGLLETLELDNRPLFFNGESLGSGAAAFVLSQTVSGRLYVSSQTLRQFGDQSLYGFYTSDAAITAAIQSYGENAERFLDSDKAKEFNPVSLENYIQAITYSAQLYFNGQTVPTNLSGSSAFYLYMAQTVPEGAVVSLVIDGVSIDIPDTGINWTNNRSRAQIALPSGHTITEATPCTWVIEYDDFTLEFDFIADPNT